MDEFTGRGVPLSQGGVETALELIGATGEALWAVLSVETSGCGYQRDRTPKILFERHYFHRLTNGRFDNIDQDVSAPTSGVMGLRASTSTSGLKPPYTWTTPLRS